MSPIFLDYADQVKQRVFSAFASEHIVSGGLSKIVAMQIRTEKWQQGFSGLAETREKCWPRLCDVNISCQDRKCALKKEDCISSCVRGCFEAMIDTSMNLPFGLDSTGWRERKQQQQQREDIHIEIIQACLHLCVYIVCRGRRV